MLDPRILRRVCQALAILAAARVLVALLKPDPLGRLTIPKVPALAAESDAAAAPNPAAQRPAVAKDNTNAAAAAPQKTPHAPSTSNAMASAKGASNAAAVPSAQPTEVAGMPARRMPPGFPGFPGGPGGGLGKPPPAPTPVVQARIDRIIQTDILGPVPRPLPMALLGIAGSDAFIRTATGQSGMVREGAELGGVKLLRIGVNRVLVEEAGVKKELTIFEGAGGASLLSP